MKCALALTAGLLAIAAPAAAEVSHLTGSFQIIVVPPPAGCVVTLGPLPAAFTGPPVNHGQIVGTISYTSDIPCAQPPTVTLTPGSVFVLDGSALPANLKFGSTDVVAGAYPFAGNAATPPGPSGSSTLGPLKSVLLPLPVPH